MKQEVLGEIVSINPAVSDMVMGDLAIDNPGEAFKLAKIAKKACF